MKSIGTSLKNAWKWVAVFVSCILVASSAFPQKPGAPLSPTRGVPAIVIFPSTSSIHVAGVQSLTAQIADRTDQRVSWSATGGSLTGSGPTVAFTANSPGTYKVTVVSVADPARSAVCEITVTPPPKPSSVHPRLWITPSDVLRLRSWAVAANPMWQNGLSAA